MTPEEKLEVEAVAKDAAEKALKEAAEKVGRAEGENQRQAASMVAGLSAQLMTAALGMIALEGAYITFAADKKDCGLPFWLLMSFAFASFVISIVCGGQATALVIRSGAHGMWSHNAGNRFIKPQTYLCFLGIGLFIVAVLLARKDKPSETGAVQKELSTVVEGLTNQAVINQQILSELQSNSLNLRLEMETCGPQLQAIIDILKKQAHVNRQFSKTLESSQRNDELQAQLAGQQLQSIARSLEKQAEINQNNVSQLQSIQDNEQLRSILEQFRRDFEQLRREVELQSARQKKKHDDD